MQQAGKQQKTCKYCSDSSLVKDGKYQDKQVYKCKNCGHKFVDNGSFAGMRTQATIIGTALDLYYDGLSVRKIRDAIARMYRVRVSEVAIWKWIMKYSQLIHDFVQEFDISLSGYYHHDETMIKVRNGGARVEGSSHYAWFWETIDHRTRFLVATHISSGRHQKEVIAQFKKVAAKTKQRPRAIFVDGSATYDRGFNKVFYSHRKDRQVALVKRVGIQARETNNMVERVHSTLKDRMKPMRSLKSMKTADVLLKGYVVNYNYIRKHQSLGTTPAKAAGIQLKIDGWYDLIEKATLSKTAGELQTVEVAAIQQEARNSN